MAMAPIKGAIQYAEYFGAQAQAAFLGQWHLRVTLMRPVVAWKARMVNVATWLFVAAVAALLVPLAFSLVRRFDFTVL
jgi:hypothetical protein